MEITLNNEFCEMTQNEMEEIDGGGFLQLSAQV
ncbi:MAG: bacteriocin [Lachnospira sp.]